MKKSALLGAELHFGQNTSKIDNNINNNYNNSNSSLKKKHSRINGLIITIIVLLSMIMSNNSINLVNNVAGTPLLISAAESVPSYHEYDLEIDNHVISPLHYTHYTINLTAELEYTSYFETASSDQLLSVYFFNEAGMSKFLNQQTLEDALVWKDDFHTGFINLVPYITKTYFVVLINWDNSNDIVVDGLVDENSDDIPYFTTNDFEIARNDAVIEPNTYYSRNLGSFSNNDTLFISLGTSISTDLVNIYIVDEYNLEKYKNNQNFSSYFNQTNTNFIWNQSITFKDLSVTVINAYLVVEGVEDNETITLSYGSNKIIRSEEIAWSDFIGLYSFLIFVGIVILVTVIAKKRKDRRKISIKEKSEEELNLALDVSEQTIVKKVVTDHIMEIKEAWKVLWKEILGSKLKVAIFLIWLFTFIMIPLQANWTYTKDFIGELYHTPEHFFYVVLTLIPNFFFLSALFHWSFDELEIKFHPILYVLIAFLTWFSYDMIGSGLIYVGLVLYVIQQVMFMEKSAPAVEYVVRKTKFSESSTIRSNVGKVLLIEIIVWLLIRFFWLDSYMNKNYPIGSIVWWMADFLFILLIILVYILLGRNKNDFYQGLKTYMLLIFPIVCGFGVYFAIEAHKSWLQYEAIVSGSEPIYDLSSIESIISLLIFLALSIWDLAKGVAEGDKQHYSAVLILYTVSLNSYYIEAGGYANIAGVFVVNAVLIAILALVIKIGSDLSDRYKIRNFSWSRFLFGKIKVPIQHNVSLDTQSDSRD